MASETQQKPGFFSRPHCFFLLEVVPLGAAVMQPTQHTLTDNQCPVHCPRSQASFPFFFGGRCCYALVHCCLPVCLGLVGREANILPRTGGVFPVSAANELGTPPLVLVIDNTIVPAPVSTWFSESAFSGRKVMVINCSLYQVTDRGCGPPLRISEPLCKSRGIDLGQLSRA